MLVLGCTSLPPPPLHTCRSVSRENFITTDGEAHLAQGGDDDG